MADVDVVLAASLANVLAQRVVPDQPGAEERKGRRTGPD